MAKGRGAAAAAFGAALAAGLMCGPAAWAGEPDGDLYVINAAGRPLGVIVDDARLPDLPRLATAHRALAAGAHGVAVVADGRVASAWTTLDATNLTLNLKGGGRPAWCYLAAGRPGAVTLTLLPPAECRQLITLGPADTHAAVGGP